MNFTSQAIIAMAVATCGNTGSQSGSSSSSSSSSSNTFSCPTWQKLVDVELDIITECQTDSDCTQVLGGTGCGCATDDLIASSGYDVSYFYDLVDESDREGCTVEFDTTCDCPVSATPVCEWGTCTWSN